MITERETIHLTQAHTLLNPSVMISLVWKKRHRQYSQKSQNSQPERTSRNKLRKIQMNSGMEFQKELQISNREIKVTEIRSTIYKFPDI